MTQTKGVLIVLTGPSGVGKGTLRRLLLQENPWLKESISVTTRPQRPTETEGVDYYFVNREQFNHMVDGDALLEWAEFAENCYGTPRQPVEDALERGESIILEIEVQGAMNIRRLMPGALLVFIEPPSMEELERRLRGRGENHEEDLQRRLAAARWELEQKTSFDHILVNEDVARCKAELCTLIQSVLSKPHEQSV